MPTPGPPSGGLPDAGLPQVHDAPPPVWTGVPVERDPLSGRRFAGDPLGREDKTRTGRGPGRAALVAAGAVAAGAAVVVAVVLVTGGGEEPGTTSASGTTTEQPTPAPAPTDTGPRDIPVSMTVTAVTPPPGFAPDPTYGTVGQVVAATWTVTGACDGAGPCEVTYCQGADRCAAPFTGAPEGTGYVARFSSPVSWGDPECTGGAVDNVVSWSMTDAGDDLVLAGTWVQQAAQVLFTGSDGRDCGVFLVDFAMASG